MYSDFEVPQWKLDAEKQGFSLPNFWTASETAKYYDVSQPYISYLVSQNKVWGYKIGQVRILPFEQFQRVKDYIKEK